MVALTIRWGVPESTEWNPVLFGTPGTACGLARGCDTQAYFGSHVNWIYDPAPPAPRRATLHSGNIPVLASDNQASAIATSVPSGAPLTPSLPKKCRRRRQARRTANQNRAPSSAAPVTPDDRWANRNAGIPGATQPQLEDSDPTSMMGTAVYPNPSIHSPTIAQPPISAANENSLFHLGLEPGEFPGLYKPAVPDPSQDSTARPFRVNNSGSSLSSPSHLQPHTKPFSGRPARPYMTCPTREAGEIRERGVGLFIR